MNFIGTRTLFALIAHKLNSFKVLEFISFSKTLPNSISSNRFLQISSSTSTSSSLRVHANNPQRLGQDQESSATINMASSRNREPKSLEFIEGFLNRWLRPTVYGENWDNIGLLIGSGHHSKQAKMVSSILLCNDLTTPVMNEALELGVQLIIAYHPPIFSPLKRIGFSWKDSIISKCLANDISVYSPHTMLDSVAFGINDAIVEMLSVLSPDKSDYQVESIVPNKSALVPVEEMIYKFKPSTAVEVFEGLNSMQDLSFGFKIPKTINDEMQLSIFIGQGSHPGRLEQIANIVCGITKDEVNRSRLNNNSLPDGAGRIIKFKTPKNIADIQKSLQTYMNIKHLKVADVGIGISSVAICAGSGGSLVKDANVDLVITGELSHHEVLDCFENGKSVILCGHSNSERHYLPTLSNVLKLFVNCPNIYISKCDKNILEWV